MSAPYKVIWPAQPACGWGCPVDAARGELPGWAGPTEVLLEEVAHAARSALGVLAAVTIEVFIAIHRPAGSVERCIVASA